MSVAVYFMYERDIAGAGDGFKIGNSVNAADRAKAASPLIDAQNSGAIFFRNKKDAENMERCLHRLFNRYRLPRLPRDGGTEWFSSECFPEFLRFVQANEALLGWSAIKYGLDVFPSPSAPDEAQGSEWKRSSAQKIAKKAARNLEMSIENRDRLINLIDYFKEHGKIVLAPAEVMPFAREALVVTAEDPEPTDWRKRTIELFMVSGFWGTNCAGHVFSDSVTEEVKYQERYHLIGLFPISKEFLVKRPGSDIEEALEPTRKTFDDLPRATEEQIELARSVANKTTCSPTARNAL